MTQVKFFIITCLSGMLAVGGLSAQVFTHPQNFQYVVPLQVQNSMNTAVTDLQFEIFMNTQALVNAGKMRSDGMDIAFTDSCQFLYFWVEDSTINTPYSRIWVKLPYLAPNSSKTVYMYYGDPSVSTNSYYDGYQVFPLFDDFNDNNLNTSFWSVYNNSNGKLILQENNQRLELRGNNYIPGNVHAAVLYRPWTDNNYEMCAKVRTLDYGSTNLPYKDGDPQVGYYTNNGGVLGKPCIFWANDDEHPWERVLNITANSTITFENINPQNNPIIFQWSEVRMRKLGNTAQARRFRDFPNPVFNSSSNVLTNTSVINPASLVYIIGAFGFEGVDMDFDFTFIRNAWPVEPVVTVGNEADNFLVTADVNIMLGYTPCDVDSIWLDAAGTALTSIIWTSPGGSQNFQPVDTLFPVLPSYDGTWHFYGEIAGCPVTDAFSVDIDSITVDLGPDQLLCDQDSLTLSVNIPNAVYTWQDGSGNSSYSVTASGTYYVEVNAGVGCIASDTVQVQMVATPSVNLGNDTLICNGISLSLDAFYPGAQYLWQDGSTFATYEVTSSGNYTVIVSNECGIATDGLIVSQVSLPSVNLGNDTTICLQQPFYLDAYQYGAIYQWNNGAVDSVIEVTQSGTYSVSLYLCGDVASDTIVLRVIQAGNVYIPDAFTPNNDGVNDTFFPVYPGESITDITLEIFNRWGQLIFKSKSPVLPWLGTEDAGTKAPLGVYVYRCTYVDICTGEEISHTGRINLLR